MRKVVVTEFMTLNGIVEAPNLWSFQFWNDKIAKFKFDELFASDTLLLGRVTYQGFAAAWPEMKDEQGFADRMNNLPKVVVSTTLQKVEWNNSSLIKANVAEEIAKLKQQAGQDILIGGSGELVNSLLQVGLVDELRLLVYPIVWGSGKRLFRDGSDTTTLKLIASQQFETGVVALTYQPQTPATH